MRLLPRFQFLLVRLKVRDRLLQLDEVIISIPTGAIKRAETVIAKIQANLFQFLLVRLKDSIRYINRL